MDLQTTLHGYIEVPVSDKLQALLSEHYDHPAAVPVEPKYAATVMLIRDNPIEVFMLRRASTMSFVPNAMVFPGGRVDPTDSDSDMPWAGPSASDWAQEMNCDESVAYPIVVAAAREVFEETGVLLAGPDGTGFADLALDRSWADARNQLVKHEISFASVLRSRNLVLRTDYLGLRARWLTPEYEPRRYDTFFFTALLPEGQTPDASTQEAAEGLWTQAGQMIEASQAGEVLLLPPTASNLAFLANANSAEAFLREHPPINQIMPIPRKSDDGRIIMTYVLP